MDRALFCSHIDAKYFQGFHQNAQTEVIYNAVDPEQFTLKRHGPGHQSRFILTGTLFYFPNIDSVHYYAQDIFPEIEKIEPGHETQIIGTRPKRELGYI